MHAFGHLLPMREAQRRLLAAVSPVERVEAVPVHEAFGRVSARAVSAPRPVPSFTRATWDGYAVRSGDNRSARRSRPVRLRVVGEVFAEDSYARNLRPGEAVAIATGGAIPKGADAVVIFEVVRRGRGTIRLVRPVARGDRVAEPGEDFRRGETLVRRGGVLDAPTLGAIAACGLPAVRVFERPVVALVPNGNELARPGAADRPGRIYESNNAALSAVIRAAGAVPLPFPPVPDDPRRIEGTLRSALGQADLVLSTGGSSVGERDLLPGILARFHPLLFHGIAVRPGKPTLAVRTGGKLVIGMPGHPTSCLLNMYWLVLPVLRKLGRRPGPGWTETVGRLGGEAEASSSGLATVVPLAFRDGRWYSTFHGSASITSLAGATAFTILPPGGKTVRAGARIPVYRLDPPLAGPNSGGSPANG